MVWPHATGNPQWQERPEERPLPLAWEGKSRQRRLLGAADAWPRPWRYSLSFNFLIWKMELPILNGSRENRNNTFLYKPFGIIKHKLITLWKDLRQWRGLEIAFSVRITRTAHQGFFPSIKARTLNNTYPKEYSRVRWGHGSREDSQLEAELLSWTQARRVDSCNRRHWSRWHSVSHRVKSPRESKQKEKGVIWTSLFHLMNRSGEGYFIWNGLAIKSQIGRGSVQTRST